MKMHRFVDPKGVKMTFLENILILMCLHILFFSLYYTYFFSKIFHQNFRISQNISFGGQTKMASEPNFVTMVATHALLLLDWSTHALHIERPLSC